MSVPYQDYLPFDGRRYVHEILPIWLRALAGETEPLKQLLQDVMHFSWWPRIKCARFVSPSDFELFLRESFSEVIERYPFQVRSHEIVDLWQVVWPIILALEQTSDPPEKRLLEILHECLAYTFCCDISAYDEDQLLVEGRTMVTRRLGTILMVNEGLDLWFGYMMGKKEMEDLWRSFYRFDELSASRLAEETGLSQRLLLGSENPLAYFKRMYVQFLSAEEVRNTFNAYSGYDSYLFEDIIDACVRDAVQRKLPFRFPPSLKTNERINLSSNKLTRDLKHQLYVFDKANLAILYEGLVDQYPELMSLFLENYDRSLRGMENQILKRMELAVSRGWGMVRIDR